MKTSECGVLMRRLLSAALLSCVLLQANAVASVARVWAVNDGEKVERDDLTNANARANSAWDGRTVKIFGARNEVIAFQVHGRGRREGHKEPDAPPAGTSAQGKRPTHRLRAARRRPDRLRRPPHT